ncbi:hypothetical protein OIO90_001581 [Microbotryomycetes sp. JL221]|nr:hypothetical protein OIO90_001581 [Microbotryomycetes sp. JL221]
MNDRQHDELLALSAIWPDQVEWRQTTIASSPPSSSTPDHQVIDVSIKIELNWEYEHDFVVWNWRPSTSSVSQVQPTLTRPRQDTDHVQISLKELEVNCSRAESASEAVHGTSLSRSRADHDTKLESQHKRTRAQQSRHRNNQRDVDRDPLSKRRQAQPRNVDYAPRSQPAPLKPQTNGDTPKTNKAPAKTFDTGRLKFQLPKPTPPPPEPMSKPTQTAAETDDSKPVSLKLQYLPSLELKCRLGDGYPGTELPLSVNVHDQIGWLGRDRLSALETKLRDVCTPDECILMLVDLVNGPALIDTLNLEFPLELKQQPPIDTDTTVPSPLSHILAAHNSTMTRLAFSSTTFDCALCLSSLKGASCVSLSGCGHVACLECLRSYYSLCITEGLVRNVACPNEACTKKRAEWDKNLEDAESVVPGQVTRQELTLIVGNELVERYEWLKEKQTTESDPSIAFCPRESCRAAVKRPTGSDFDEATKLRECDKCGHSFCVICLKTWHGTRNPCSLPQTSSIVSRYLEGDDNERAALELRYGRANVKRIVAAYEEERANTQWRQEHSMQCPGCSIWVERSQGCAHMQCARCSTHFCFKCGKSLSPTNPYAHFSTPGSTCYNKLFDFRPGGEPAPEQWIAEVLVDEGERQLNEAFHPQGWNPFA